MRLTAMEAALMEELRRAKATSDHLCQLLQHQAAAVAVSQQQATAARSTADAEQQRASAFDAALAAAGERAAVMEQQLSSFGAELAGAKRLLESSAAGERKRIKEAVVEGVKKEKQKLQVAADKAAAKRAEVAEAAAAKAKAKAAKAKARAVNHVEEKKAFKKKAKRLEERLVEEKAKTKHLEKPSAKFFYKLMEVCPSPRRHPLYPSPPPPAVCAQPKHESVCIARTCVPS